jgi:hypothetical protein
MRLRWRLGNRLWRRGFCLLALRVHPAACISQEPPTEAMHAYLTRRAQEEHWEDLRP